MFPTPTADARLLRHARDPDAGRRLGSLSRPTSGAAAVVAAVGASILVAVLADWWSEQVAPEPQDPDELPHR
jgi:hypothetical protein